MTPGEISSESSKQTFLKLAVRPTCDPYKDLQWY
jgi:hypothetical protein